MELRVEVEEGVVSLREVTEKEGRWGRKRK